MGQKTNYVQFDTATIDMAVNDGIWRVATDIGCPGRTAIKLVSDQVEYTIDTTLIPGGTKAMPISVSYKSNSGISRHGLRRLPDEDFVVVEQSSDRGTDQGIASQYRIKGRQLSISQPQSGDDSLIVEGPKYPLWIDSSGDTTNIYSVDSYAVVYWACRELAVARQNFTAAQMWHMAYVAHVNSRGGAYSGPPMPVGQ